jgi:hypothetical protein
MQRAQGTHADWHVKGDGTVWQQNSHVLDQNTRRRRLAVAQVRHIELVKT